MFNTESFIRDADLINAFSAGPVHTDGRDSSYIELAASLRLVAEMAIAAYLDGQLPGKLLQLDRVTDAVERFTGEVLK
jgi:hypothetical protein